MPLAEPCRRGKLFEAPESDSLDPPNGEILVVKSAENFRFKQLRAATSMLRGLRTSSTTARATRDVGLSRPLPICLPAVLSVNLWPLSILIVVAIFFYSSITVPSIGPCVCFE